MSLDSTGESVDNDDSGAEDYGGLDDEAASIRKKYGKLPGDIYSIDLELDRPGQELGLVLAGSRTTDQMNTYVALVKENGVAFNDGRLEVGDQILEVTCSGCLICFNYIKTLKKVKHLVQIFNLFHFTSSEFFN